MSDRRSIHGVWLIERLTGRNLISKAYTGVTIDMDLIAPFLSATFTFIDKASNEELTTIDTETNRYVWESSEHLLLVMVVSKAARLGHMRFILKYALNEFLRNEVPADVGVSSMLKSWTGAPSTFKKFGDYINTLVEQFEITDEALVAGKAMDCLEVYNHLFRAIMKAKFSKSAKKKLMKRVKERIEPLFERYLCLDEVVIDECGIEVLGIDVYNVQYKVLRECLEELLRIITDAAKKVMPEKTFREMIFEHAMPYVKRDLNRLQTYAILDDVIRYLF
ncbi:MAG: hypothetical protein ACTSUO_07825 [Candidatus Thorarchaeota archaeon]